MQGYVDLHSHFLPGVDDGAQTIAESVQICQGLLQIGFDTVVATPHIRTAMFDNTKAGLTTVYHSFLESVADISNLPQTSLAAEHYCNDVFWQLLERGEILPYPKSRAVLLELPIEQIPIKVADRFFQMNIRGFRPVLAHPERYLFLFRNTQPIERILEIGVLAILDLRALVGTHGRKPKRTAERMLDEGVYFAASSDAHCSGDVEKVLKGIKRLRALVGEEKAHQLLKRNPLQIIQGSLGNINE